MTLLISFDRAILNQHLSKLDFVRLGREAQCLGHTYDARCGNVLQFSVRRGARLNVAGPELEPNGADCCATIRIGIVLPH